MKKLINGVYVEMQADEIAAIESEIRKVSLMERSRSLSESEVSRMIIAAQINTLTVDDNTALRMLTFYPEWAINTSYAVGYKVKRNGKLWRVGQEHTSQAGWEPENAASLWTEINETHAGTLDDPIPYNGNMALVNGLYYVQDYVIYRCNRDTVNPVYNALHDLIGIYVEEG